MHDRTIFAFATPAAALALLALGGCIVDVHESYDDPSGSVRWDGYGPRCDARPATTQIPPRGGVDAGVRPEAGPPTDAGPGPDVQPAIDRGADAAAASQPGGAPRPDAGPDGASPPASAGLCRIDAQCGGGKCVAGACQRACSSTTPCGTGAICRDGRCQPSPTAGPECLYSSQCGPGGACINGFCHAACQRATDCLNAADTCDRGLCRPDGRPVPQCTSSAQCPAAWSCVDAICRTPCASDAQCGPHCSGTVCASGFCVMPVELTPPLTCGASLCPMK